MNKNFLLCAIQMATDNVVSGNGGPFGAVVAKGGKIIAKATNTVTITNDPTAHAEVNAIRQACKVLNTFDLSGCEIYASCEPCPMCLSAIYWSRITKVYYAATRGNAALAGFDDAYIYQELAKPNDQKSIQITHVDCPEAKNPFSLWERSTNKTEY